MGSYCPQCDTHDGPHKTTCYWYPKEAKERDKTIEQLIRFVVHTGSCKIPPHDRDNRRLATDDRCTCGLYQIAKKIEEIK